MHWIDRGFVLCIESIGYGNGKMEGRMDGNGRIGLDWIKGEIKIKMEGKKAEKVGEGMARGNGQYMERIAVKRWEGSQGPRHDEKEMRKYLILFFEYFKQTKNNSSQLFKLFENTLFLKFR